MCACMYIRPCVHIHTSPRMHMPVGGSDCQQLGGLTGACLCDRCWSWNPQGRQTGRQDGGKQEEKRDRLECTHWSPHGWAGTRLSSICLSPQLHTCPTEAPYSWDDCTLTIPRVRGAQEESDRRQSICTSEHCLTPRGEPADKPNM